MLSDRCLSCLSCPVLSVTLVYCGQTVRQIKMKLGIVLDGDPAFPATEAQHPPPFRPMSIVAKVDQSQLLLSSCKYTACDSTNYRREGKYTFCR